MSTRPVDPFGPEYAYVQVADDVQRRIAEGEISAKLPSERSFAEEYGVAYTTVRHAMAVLRERGIIVTVHGRGTYVKPQGPHDALLNLNPLRKKPESFRPISNSFESWL